MVLKLNKELKGRILDIGGGGEGVIGRLYTSQVIAIDNSQAELDETPDGFEKILMDATDLQFADGSFEHVTFFYTLMFMSEKEQKRALLEEARVLNAGGQLHIWDCDIVSAYPEPFCVDVIVRLPNECISATYGIGKLDAQNMASITKLCTEVGLTLIGAHTDEWGFRLRFQKRCSQKK